MPILTFFFVPLVTGPSVNAQSGLSLPTIPLESLSSFDNPGENWTLADSVYSLEPGVPETIIFRTSDKLGEYTFVCTFPGHTATMQGVIRVVAH